MSAPRPEENVIEFPCSPRLHAMAERAKRSTEEAARQARERVNVHPVFATILEPYQP